MNDSWHFDRKVHRERRGRVMDGVRRDLRFGLRSLRRSAGLTFVAVLTIAVGVGATTTIFSIANELLLRPVAVRDADALVTVQEQRRVNTSSGVEGVRVPYTRYRAYEERTRDVFDALAAHRADRFSVRLDERTVSVDGERVSESYFPALALRPELGRFFARDDVPEVVLSHRFWRQAFAGSAGVIGRTVHIDSHPYTVVGVAPAGFRGTLVGVAYDLWVPSRASGEAVGGEWASSWVAMFGRLRPGVTRERAQLLVNAAALGIPPENGARVDGADLESLAGLPGQARLVAGAAMAVLLGLALLVLLIGSANVAGALLARSLARRREIAVRLAIGAGRGTLVRQLLVESLLLFLAGGIAGIVLAYTATAWIAALPLPVSTELALDLEPNGLVLSFALALTAVTGLVFGLVPAFQASRPDVVTALKAGGGGGDRSGNRIRGIFVTGQIAASVVLLLVAVLFTRSFRSGLSVDPGFDPDGVVLATIDLAPHGFDEARGRAFYAALLDRITAMPGVKDATLAQFAMLSLEGFGSDVTVPDADGSGVRRSTASWNSVGPSYMRTMGVQLVAGREFTARDDRGAPRVAIINRTLATRLWPGGNPVGRRFRRGSTEFEVVGVARDGKYVFLAEGPTPYVFVPFGQQYEARMTLHVRAPGAEAATLAGIADAVRAVDPNVALERAEPMSRTLDRALFPHRFAAQLVGALGLVGLLLAALGLYAVLAYQVTRRTREFGIRRALGARHADVWRDVLRRGAALACIGCAVGLAMGAGAAVLARAFLLGVDPLDVPTFIAVPAILFVVAILAGMVPAARATSVQAVEALRAE